ncbi:hypothetical protein BX591_12786 [Paraburkholderia bryophila]|uniref:Uncharacterized protein n=1 Tax=Paraburkholderia bryophila TaxID=420952 RepID=A0A329BS05_9BURK|nr:hypothetical protein BX591_12786 [Paraburkholderia bryophila]
MQKTETPPEKVGFLSFTPQKYVSTHHWSVSQSQIEAPAHRTFSHTVCPSDCQTREHQAQRRQTGKATSITHRLKPPYQMSYRASAKNRCANFTQ